MQMHILQVKSDYIVLFLAKHNPGSSWSHMTFAEKTAADAKKKSDDVKFDDKADPSAGLMNVSLNNSSFGNKIIFNNSFSR